MSCDVRLSKLDENGNVVMKAMETTTKVTDTGIQLEVCKQISKVQLQKVKLKRRKSPHNQVTT